MPGPGGKSGLHTSPARGWDRRLERCRCRKYGSAADTSVSSGSESIHTNLEKQGDAGARRIDRPAALYLLPTNSMFMQTNVSCLGIMEFTRDDSLRDYGVTYRSTDAGLASSG